jgi:hypothetical protein
LFYDIFYFLFGIYKWISVMIKQIISYLVYIKS